MLSLALLATVVGFVLLVVALMTGNLPLAIACVVVCVVGLILLVVDTLRANRRGSTDEDDEPLFTIRGRESAAREEPLEDDASTAPAGAAAAGAVGDAPLSDTPVSDDSAAESNDSGGVAPYGDSTATSWALREGQSSTGLGSLVAPSAEQRLGDGPATDPGPASGSGGFATLSGGFAAAPQSDGDSTGGDVTDYLRSTGSFPAQPPAQPEPFAQPPAEPPAQPPSAAAPERSTAPDWSAKPAAADRPVESVPEVVTSEASQPDATPPSDSAPQSGTGSRSDAAPSAEPAPQSEPYVGRRRLAGDPTDDIVVRSANPDLPAMQFVWDDPDVKPKDDPTN
ncbi:hypothetical protein [Gordonia hydrophobica]|uniref:Uncharacterized protein n=1 Tax=Gordonia hydrophobica TaxID=40516 RepID=A0ABZ2TYH3_9ACTN|nr:hypothetical protein [Gordonia hydrophobica]MBM7367123.1 hypothetical protein [Gordonia hydrophobica]